MTPEERREILKADLQLMTSAFDTYLGQLLDAAEQFINGEGITLTDSAEDEQLRVMYAAYLYRSRAKDNAEMPRMLRWALNNRLFSQKGAACDDLC